MEVLVVLLLELFIEFFELYILLHRLLKLRLQRLPMFLNAPRRGHGDVPAAPSATSVLALRSAATSAVRPVLVLKDALWRRC